MDKREFLNFKQLFDVRRRSSKVVGSFNQFRPSKRHTSVPQDEESLREYENILDQVLFKRYEIMKRHRVKLHKDIGKAIFDPKSGRINVTCLKNKPESMGYVVNGETYLEPEEAIFLMEMDCLQLLRSGIPLSLSEALSLLFTSTEALERYKVYAYLTRLGYSVKKYRKSSIVSNCPSKIESKIHREAELTKEAATVDEEVLCDVESLRVLLNQNMEKLKKSDFLTRSDSKGCLVGIHQYIINQKANNWREYKEMMNVSTEMNLVENTDAVVFNLQEEALKHCQLHKLLPSSALDTEVLRFVNDPASFITLPELYRKLQAAGPQCYEDNISSIRPLKISYECYASKKTSTYEEPKFYVVVCNSTNPPPSLTEIVQLNTACKKNLFFAVTDNSDLNFYELKTFTCWDEIPEVWRCKLNQR